MIKCLDFIVLFDFIWFDFPQFGFPKQVFLQFRNIYYIYI